MDLQKRERLDKIADTLRCLTMDIVSHAGSGHPGMPMGCAEILAYLYGEFMQYHPESPIWVNRDRFLLSAGHGALGQFHMAGYDITLEDLRQHRQGSIKASSHPLYNPKLGIETTTGADGYGLGNAVGMALGQKSWPISFTRIKNFFLMKKSSSSAVMDALWKGLVTNQLKLQVI